MIDRKIATGESKASHRLWPLLLLATACGGGGGGGSVEVPEAVTAAAVIGPEGGTVAVTEGPHTGVSLTVPVGAVAIPTRFTITVDVGNPAILSLFPVYRFAPRDVVAASGTFTVIVRGGDPLFETGGADSVCFRQDAPGAVWNVVPDGTVDLANQRVTSRSDRLGDFVAWNGSLHRLFTTQRTLLDPAVPTPGENLGNVPVLVPNGSVPLVVGRGSLASFWSSPASANLLIVPGLIGSPIDFLWPDDLVASLAPGVQNIVLLSYPSASGVAATANALYDEIVARQRPGFGCSIVGHSMGGLVARYLLEQSHLDRARTAYLPTDVALAPRVKDLVLLGVPNAGADLGSAIVATLLPRIPASEQVLLQAAIDISYRADAVTMRMNASYVDNATRYHILYGDVGGASDGVVTVASTLALPLFGPETAQQFAVNHDDLHGKAALNGIATRIDAILQMP
jgi:pimeloyl-ACP methyl ester carboxylesterase